MSWEQVLITAAIYTIILGLWFQLKNKRRSLFYVTFPVVVTLSVQLVGIYLVFASLIIPALGAEHFKNKLAAGYMMAFLAFTTGLISSIIIDSPAGPTLVGSYALVCSLAYFVRRVRV